MTPKRETMTKNETAMIITLQFAFFHRVHSRDRAACKQKREKEVGYDVGRDAD